MVAGEPLITKYTENTPWLLKSSPLELIKQPIIIVNKPCRTI